MSDKLEKHLQILKAELVEKYKLENYSPEAQGIIIASIIFGIAKMQFNSFENFRNIIKELNRYIGEDSSFISVHFGDNYFLIYVPGVQTAERYIILD